MKLGSINLAFLLAGALAVVPLQMALAAQSPTTAASPSRVVGSVTAINGQVITVKPDSGAPVTFTVGENAKILETQPGAKTLAGAAAIPLSGIAVGDRVLAALHPGADGSALTATTVIAMKHAAVAEHQQAEEAEWQKNGVGGLVKSVDAAAGTLTITSGAHTITIHTTPATVVRRYSPDSIQFADARPSSLADIHAGDQLRAKGEHSADGSEVTANAIVAGSFRNIAGTVESTDAAAGTLTVKDLATKKAVVIHITADSRMHKLPEEMAQELAMRMKRKPRNHAGASGHSEEHAGSRQDGGAQQQRQGSGDLSQMLQRTPVVQISELHKGDDVMIVATQGTPDSATAVTLLAGVEPILRASPSASQSMFSASWSLGGGGSSGDEGGGGDSGGNSQ